MALIKKCFSSSTGFHYIEVDEWATTDEVVKILLDKIEALEKQIEDLKANG